MYVCMYVCNTLSHSRELSEFTHALCSENIPGRPRRLYSVLGIEIGLAVFKENALLAVHSLHS